jgi:bla regulator protein BlaR1
MLQLFQSAFLQSLGFALANSLWQTALLWLIYTAISQLLPLSSAAKYRLAVFAQLTSFIWFVITIQFYYSQYHALLSSASVGQGGSIQSLAAGNNGFISQVLRYLVLAEQVLPYVSMAYLLLMLVLSIRWFSGYRQTQLVRTNGLQKIPVEWRLFVERIAGQLGIKKNIRLYLSETISTPLTIGFLKPIILVPVASINHLSTQQLEAVLLHELAHIKRYDYLVNIILSAVEIGLFFNPFTQLLSKQIHKERENSCDDWVLQFEYRASDYAEALLRIAYLQSAPALAMAATGKKNDLLVRVKRMIGQKENRFNYRRQLLALALVTTILSSIAWLNPVATRHSATAAASEKTIHNEHTRTIAIEPMTLRVDNPLFNPISLLTEPLKAEMQKNLAIAQKEMAGLVTAKNGHPPLVETIPSIVVGALEKASKEMGGKHQEMEKELDNITYAKTTLEGLLKDSVSFPANLRFNLDDAFRMALENMPAEINRVQKEMPNQEQLKKQFNLGLDKFKWDNEKVKKDISRAMDELKQLSFDRFSFDIQGATTDKQKEETEKQSSGKKSMPMMHFKKSTAPPSPEEPEQPTLLMNAPSGSPVIRVNNKNFVLELSPAMIAELASLAELATRVNEQSPEYRKMLQLKLAIIGKALAGRNKLLHAVNMEKIELDSVSVRLQ